MSILWSHEIKYGKRFFPLKGFQSNEHRFSVGRKDKKTSAPTKGIRRVQNDYYYYVWPGQTSASNGVGMYDDGVCAKRKAKNTFRLTYVNWMFVVRPFEYIVFDVFADGTENYGFQWPSYPWDIERRCLARVFSKHIWHFIFENRKIFNFYNDRYYLINSNNVRGIKSFSVRPRICRSTSENNVDIGR